MTNITRFNFSNDKQITAQKADNINDFLWIAFAKNANGNCIIEKTGKFKPSQTYYSLNREVEEVTAMDLDSSNIYVTYNDSSLLGERLSKTNPLTSTTEISKGSYIESPVDILVNSTDLWVLLPGSVSGENAKLLKYNTSGTFQQEIDLAKSGSTVFNAQSMSIVSGGDIWIATYTSPTTLVRVFEVSTDVYDFTVQTQPINFASKIVSFNPLIFITDTIPAKIIKTDITDPENPTYESATLVGINNATDAQLNSDNTYIYIAGDTGQVVKVLISDLSDQTIIDVSDTDDLITLERNNNFGITYAGTDNEIGELYVIDERSTFKLDSDFHVLAPIDFQINSSFYITSNFKIDSDFTVLAETTFNISTDFKCKTAEVDDIEPIGLPDYKVFVDSVELGDTDLVLDSINITHTIAQESRATFRLSRKHDQLNTTLDGNTVSITNKNSVKITIDGKTEFEGNVSRVRGIYEERDEFVQVEALAPEKTNSFNNITMSLPGLNNRLSLYDVLMETPDIYNPVIDPENEENPKKFLGIRVNLGEKTTQQVSRTVEFDSFGSIAEAIQNGDFNPLQNWTYFWSPTVRKLVQADLGETQAITFFYIGTSLSPVGNDLWDLTNARHKRQRIYEDKVVELGNYEVGEAPFNTVGVPRSGKLISKFRWVDESNGLYSIKDASFNFEDFAKQVADLEFEALKNINGEILPETSCSLTMTIDAYLFYQISLLTRIKIDNTTEANIYKNQNGFPVSVKSITITSSDRKVSIQADNLKSASELEVINSQFPDPDDDEFNQPERRILIALKTDISTRLQVE